MSVPVSDPRVALATTELLVHDSRYDPDRVLGERWICAGCDWAGKSYDAFMGHHAELVIAICDGRPGE